MDRTPPRYEAPFSELWNMEKDNELAQSGGDMMSALGWAVKPDTPVELAEQVI